MSEIYECPVCGHDMVKYEGIKLWQCNRHSNNHFVQILLHGGNILEEEVSA